MYSVPSTIDTATAPSRLLVAAPPTRQPAKPCPPSLPRPTPDIHVVTFPKCGTTFTEQIVLLLLNGGDASSLDPKHQNGYSKDAPERGGKVWIESSVRVHAKDFELDPPNRRARKLTLEEFNAIASPRVIKTHAPRDLFLATLPCSPPSLSDSSRCRPEPLAPGIKVVYTSRQAKDAVVSAYYHAKVSEGLSAHYATLLRRAPLPPFPRLPH